MDPRARHVRLDQLQIELLMTTHTRACSAVGNVRFLTTPRPYRSFASYVTLGRQAFRYELRTARMPLTTEAEGVSPQALLDAIRTAARSRLAEP